MSPQQLAPPSSSSPGELSGRERVLWSDGGPTEPTPLHEQSRPSPHLPQTEREGEEEEELVPTKMKNIKVQQLGFVTS